MNKKQKIMLCRIAATAVLLLALNLLPIAGAVRIILYLAAYLTIGYDILRKAGKGIAKRRMFDENFLMAVATVGAIALAIIDKSGDFNEAVLVMLFYQIGELFQGYAVGKSRRNISALMDIRPDYANVECDGQLKKVDPDEVAVSSVIVVQPGEKVPIDGEVISGQSSLNTSALTGESLPRDVRAGDEVISGCINMTGVLRVLQRAGAGRAAAGGSPDPGHGCAVGGVDLPRADLPDCQLPLRAGHQHPAQLLRRHRRRQQGGRAGQGLQLSGGAVPHQDGCV